MLWQNIPYQTAVKNYLSELYLNNRLPHALLIKGEEGSATLPIALGFMQFLHCDNQNKKLHPCGECKSCKQTKNLFFSGFQLVIPAFSTSQKNENEENDTYKVFYELFKENIFITFDDVLKATKGKNKQALITVQTIHQIIENVSYSALGNKYNIICIWHPESMLPSAANKLLKTLEEPPPQTLFLLVTSKPEELLATILSRIQQISIPHYTQKEMVDFLIEKYQIDSSKAQEISEISNGNINKAIQLLTNLDEYIELLNDFKEFARLAIKFDYDEIDNWIKKYESKGRESLKFFLEYSMDVFHNALIQNFNLPQLIKTTQQEKEFISKFYLYAHQENIPALFEIFNDAYLHTTRNANIRILLNDLFLRCNELLKKKKSATDV